MRGMHIDLTDEGGKVEVHCQSMADAKQIMREFMNWIICRDLKREFTEVLGVMTDELLDCLEEKTEGNWKFTFQLSPEQIQELVDVIAKDTDGEEDEACLHTLN